MDKSQRTSFETYETNDVFCLFVQAPATVVDTEFSGFKEKKPITSKLLPISRKFQNKSCTSSRGPTNGVFTKIQGPYPITYEFLNITMEKTSTDTVTDSSF
jgi:hypothetical protein